jgi:hypothetical protein
MQTRVSLAREEVEVEVEVEVEEGIMGKLAVGRKILLVMVVMMGLLDCSRTKAIAKVGVRVEVGRMSMFRDDIECLFFLF